MKVNVYLWEIVNGAWRSTLLGYKVISYHSLYKFLVEFLSLILFYVGNMVFWCIISRGEPYE